MHVKPLEGSQQVKYRLLSAEKKSVTRVSESGEPLYDKPIRDLAPKVLVRDIETGSKVMIGNVVGYEVKNLENGQTINRPRFKGVRFVNQEVLVDATKNELYQYMERHNANESNPFRDRTKPAVYYRVDPKKKALKEYHTISMKGEAITWISAADHIELKSINDGLPKEMKVDMNKSWDEIKTEMLRLADKDPVTVMKYSRNRPLIVRLTIMECENYGILMWEEDRREWFFNDSETTTIANVQVGSDRYVALAEFLLSTKEENGRKILKQIQTKLKKFLNQGSPD